MFKRKTPLSYWEWFVEGIFPRSGWRRVLYYVRHRLQRLPDSPHRIALGFSLGVFVCFTPVFGLHIILAIVLSLILRANVMAAIIGTFFGNPVTFPLIAGFSYRLGWFLLGKGEKEPVWHTIQAGFNDAFASLWRNFKTMFTADTADWTGLHNFWESVFLPYAVGGFMPGFVIAVLFYLGLRPLVHAYQKRRKGRLIAKLKEMRNKRKSEAELPDADGGSAGKQEHGG